jgi:hypothetical protein
MYSIIGVALGLIGIWIAAKKLRATGALYPKIVVPHYLDFLCILFCIGVTIVLWLIGNRAAPPAYDEVFSAENIAGIHPFQAVSYYMLPNNHIFFNFLNGTIFHPFADKVATGRLLSLVAYSGVIVTLFLWLKGLIKNRLVAVIVSLALATQFPVWGFGFQARGYALYLLCEWGALIALFSYLQHRHASKLYVYALCCVAGYFCLPSFLYLHLSLVVFMAFYHRKDRAFWRLQLFILATVFILYLPTFCFSGIDAIIKNKYVGPMNHYKTTGEFMQWMFPVFGDFINNIYSGIKLGNTSLGITLLLLPLAMLFAKRNSPTFMLALFYLVLWTLFLLMTIAMKRLPFERNLVFHYSYTLFCDLWVIYWITGLLIKDVRWAPPAVAIAAAASGYHYIKTNNTSLKEGLYSYDVAAHYQSVNEGLKFIPAGSTVAFSDEGFYCCYLSRKQGCIVHKCPSGRETYFVKNREEQLPGVLSGKYVLASSFNDYEIYKHK